ncbi:MAG TPA: hypothetical protein VFF48_01555 [Brevundimonas sp.]|nr:hypothetical protein [Brevundimonas sp.]
MARHPVTIAGEFPTMKLLVTAAALLLAPAAQAQVAAATVPNSFDRPASAAPAPVRTAAPAAPPAAQAAPAAPVAPVSSTPANARSEEILREIIGGGQSGALPYALMTEDLANRVKAQEATVLPLLRGFGAVQALDFTGSQSGADMFAVVFANASTEWIIGIDGTGKVAALLFRPKQ